MRRFRWFSRQGRQAVLVQSARVLLLGVLVTGAAAAQTENSFEERVNALAGYWLAPSKEAAQARVLHIANVVFVDTKSTVLAGYFGTASSPIWPEATDLIARLEGKRIVLDIVSADNARITLTTTADGELRGGAGRHDGAPLVLRFSRVSLPEIHRFAAENPLPQARARRGSKIELVYIGADDCSMCRAWEAANLGQGKLENSAEWKHLHFTRVKLATLSTAFRVEHAPHRLQPVFSEMLDGGVRIQGIPSFVLLVDDNLRAHALGPARFDTLVHAAVRAAVREKLAAERR